MKYQCLLADDNVLELDVLQMYLGKIKSLEIAAVCSNGLEAAALLKEKEIDIVFTDIDMPELSGIGLLQSLKHPPVFIFISAYSEYAAEGFNLDVIDFIVKPVTLPRLMKAADKAIEYIELKKQVNAAPAAIPTGSEISATLDDSDYFFIKENNGFTQLLQADVLFIESMGDFSRLYTVHQKKHVTLVSLKNAEKQLPSHLFMRVHKQYIVNVTHIESISSAGDINLTGKHSVPVSNAYKTALMEIVNSRLMSRSSE